MKLTHVPMSKEEEQEREEALAEVTDPLFPLARADADADADGDADAEADPDYDDEGENDAGNDVYAAPGGSGLSSKVCLFFFFHSVTVKYSSPKYGIFWGGNRLKVYV